MKDHRINRQKLHPLENIIAIAIVSIICGAETWEEVSLDGKIRKKIFSKFLNLKNGIPSKDTFRRFFAALILSFDEKPCHDFYQTLDYGHGRIEERKCSIIKDLNFETFGIRLIKIP